MKDTIISPSLHVHEETEAQRDLVICLRSHTASKWHNQVLNVSSRYCGQATLPEKMRRIGVELSQVWLDCFVVVAEKEG